MAAGAVGALRYKEKYNYGTAAPARAPYYEPYVKPAEETAPRERAVPRELPRKSARERQREAGVSLFAIVGTLVVTALMVFVMLAQINLNQLVAQTARHTSQLDALTQQNRVLAIAFENVVDMKEIERYAKDVLGMSKPEAEQYVVIRTLPSDRAEVIEVQENEGGLYEFGSFLTYLFDEYIR